MKPTEKHEFEVSTTPVVQSNPALLGRVRKFLKAIFGPSQLHDDLNRLNPRLRRDVGIDEHKLERIKLEKAPLIR